MHTFKRVACIGKAACQDVSRSRKNQIKCTIKKVEEPNNIDLSDIYPRVAKIHYPNSSPPDLPHDSHQTMSYSCPGWKPNPEEFAGRKGAVKLGTLSRMASGTVGEVTNRR